MNLNNYQWPEFIEGDSGKIEYDWIATNREKIGTNLIAVVCHPHPLHGGTKDNKVVHTLCRALRDSGIASIRFNFRGVGKSEGEYGDGKGELEDLRSVVKFIRNELESDAQLIFAGFSFGAAIAARYVSSNPAKALILVAPPVTYPELGIITRLPDETLIVQGRQDELVEYASVQEWVDQLNEDVRFVVLDDAEHFFHGKLPLLKQFVQDFLDDLLSK